MDNKNEKTFADLFSSSSPENNSEDVKDNNLNKDIAKDNYDDSKSVTFDSLFDKVESEKNEEITDEFVGKEEGVGLNSLFEKSSQLNEQNESSSSSDVSMSEVLKQVSEDDSRINKVSFSQVNSLFDTPFSEEKKITDVPEEFDDSKKISFDKIFEEKVHGTNDIFEDKSDSVQESTEVINPFLNDSIDNSYNNEEIQSNESFEKNPLFEGNRIEQTFVEEDNVGDGSKDSNNPFLESDIVEESSFEDNLNNNPFLQEESTVDNNLFFENTSSVQVENTDNFISKSDSEIRENFKEDSSDFWSEQKDDDKALMIEEKSVSPFFESETLSSENPLFLDKVNLIENIQSTKKSSNIDMSKIKHYDIAVVKKKEPLIKFILGVISYAIFILLLLIGVALLVYVLDIKIRAAKGDYSSPTFNAYVVLTGSMLPEIQVYDVVVTKKIDASKLEEGDVITFASADTRFLNTIITHRIIKKNYDSQSKTYSFQTRGDNNNVADSALVPQNNIYGKVILKIPKLGYLQEFLASDGGWIIVILIPCLTVISYDIVKLIKGLKRRKYKNIKVQK